MPASPRRPLRDVACARPRLLLVGINPGLRSAAVGHHFAGRGNPFWRLLHAAGLTPEPLDAEQDARLAELGVALTNVCPRPTRSADELTPAELAAGARTLRRKIARWRPEVVALVGVGLQRVVLGHARPPGPGPKPDRIAGARVYVLPNPSGLNASYPGFAQKLAWYRGLAAFLVAR